MCVCVCVWKQKIQRIYFYMIKPFTERLKVDVKMLHPKNIFKRKELNEKKS